MNVAKCIQCALVLQLLWLAIGCCSGTQTTIYEWTGLEAVNLDNTGLAPVESSAPGVPALAYGIRARISRMESPAAGTSLFPTAAACVGFYDHINRDTLLAIQIHAISDDTADQPRDVTDDFRVLVGYQTELSDKILTIPTMIERLGRRQVTVDDRIDFIRTEHALPSPGLRFILTMRLSGGKTFADTTTAIALI